MKTDSNNFDGINPPPIREVDYDCPSCDKLQAENQQLQATIEAYQEAWKISETQWKAKADKQAEEIERLREHLNSIRECALSACDGIIYDIATQALKGETE